MPFLGSRLWGHHFIHYKAQRERSSKVLPMVGYSNAIHIEYKVAVGGRGGEVTGIE